MKGTVDDKGRALLDIPIRLQPTGNETAVTVWIDTAFDGHLVFPGQLIARLGLDSLADTEAILADGSKVILETFLCYVTWFEAIVPVQVIKNDGILPLLGVGLLNSHILHIDYQRRMLELN